MEYFTIRNWSKFQHYRDRNPPWIRLHYELLASMDWAMASDADKALMVVCMLVGSRNQGQVPNSPSYMKRVGCLTHTPNFKYLVGCGFLEKPLAPCKQDASDVEQDDSKPLALTTRVTEVETEAEDSVISNEITLSLSAPEQDFIKTALDEFNALARRVGLPVAEKLTEARRAAIRKRLAEYGGIEGWRAALGKIEKSSFLRGDNDRGWRADLDFLCQAKSFTRLMEGKYDDRKPIGDVSHGHASEADASKGKTAAQLLAERHPERFGNRVV